MKKKKKHFYVKQMSMPIYRGQFVIIFTNDAEKLHKKVSVFEGNEVYASANLDNWEGIEGFIIALNFDNKNRAITHGCVAHESSHIAHMVLEQRGVIADFINDEPVTYLIEWITDQVYKFADEKKMVVKSNTEI